MSMRLAPDSTPKALPRSEARTAAPQFSIDSTGRVYQKFFGQWRRMRGVNASQIVNASQYHLQRSLKVLRFQRYAIWSLVILAIVLLYLRGCK